MTSDIHQTKFAVKKVSVLLGYPAQEGFDVDNMFPYHELWSELGGCLIAVDEKGRLQMKLKKRLNYAMHATNQPNNI